MKAPAQISYISWLSPTDVLDVLVIVLLKKKTCSFMALTFPPVAIWKIFCGFIYSS